MKILTIIIPTYNMERLLRKNLQSLVIEDKVLMKNLEVLVVNDGSKDKSSEIAHEFEKTYPETFRVIDKENGNYGSCINRGLKEAHGKYVRIMDADDWYDTRNLQKFLKQLETVDADKIATKFTVVKHTHKKRNPLPFKKNVNLDMRTFTQTDYIPMHAVTYRTQLLRDMGYVQTEGISYTDQEWILLPTPFVKTLHYIPLDIYQYYVGREGQTMDPTVLKKAYPQLFRITNRILSEYVKSLPGCPNREYAIVSVYRTVRWIYSIIFRQVKFDGDIQCLYDLESLIEIEFPEIYTRLSQETDSYKYQYKYIDAWRKQGRPNVLNDEAEMDFRAMHKIQTISRYPVIIYRKIKKYVGLIIDNSPFHS